MPGSMRLLMKIDNPQVHVGSNDEDPWQDPCRGRLDWAVATVVVLGASTEVPIWDGPELLTVGAVVAVKIVEGAEWAVGLG